MENGENLVDQFFHAFDGDGNIQYQGQVIGALGAGYYQCQLFSALMGEPTNRIVKHISEMTGWNFFSEELWPEACDNFFSRGRQ